MFNVDEGPQIFVDKVSRSDKSRDVDSSRPQVSSYLEWLVYTTKLDTFLGSHRQQSYREDRVFLHQFGEM